MGKLEVIFSDLDKLSFNYNHNYALYMHGCFCPPHKGHLDPIDKLLKKIHYGKLNIFINQIGGKRHGVDRETNYFIMKTYLKELYPHIKYKHFEDEKRKNILNSSNLYGIDTIIISKGAEDDINIHDYNIQKKLYENCYNKYNYLTSKYNVIVMYLDRIGYSATKFTENMIELKDKHNKYNKKENVRKCAEFIPDIGNEHKKIILKKIAKHHLVV